MAASSFQSLYAVVGNRALDEIVPTLMVAFSSPDEQSRARALNGKNVSLAIAPVQDILLFQVIQQQ